MIWITIGLIVSYILLTKIIAFFAYRKSFATLEDYYVVNRSLGTILLVGTLFATVFNAMAVTATPGQVFEGGVLFLQFYGFVFITPFLFYSIGSKVQKYVRGKKIYTQGELLFEVYNSLPLKIIASLVAITSLFPFLAVQMIAVGKIVFEATSGIVSFEMAVIVLSAVVAIYLLFGGSRAVVWTDLFQGIVFFIIHILTAVLFVYWTGGLTEAVTTLPEVIPEKLEFNKENTPLFLDRVISWTLAFFFWPHIFQRCLMARSSEVVKKTALYTILINFVGLSFSLIIGIAATVALSGEILDYDKVVAQMYSKYLPIGGALVVLTVFASGMSTIDSMLLSLSSIITRDTVKKNKKLDERTKFNLARLVSFISVTLTCLFVLSDYGRGAIAPLTTIGAAFASLFLWPFIGAFYWKRASKHAAFYSMLFGAVAILLVEFSVFGRDLFLGSATIGFIISGFTFFILSLFNKS